MPGKFLPGMTSCAFFGEVCWFCGCVRFTAVSRKTSRVCVGTLLSALSPFQSKPPGASFSMLLISCRNSASSSPQKSSSFPSSSSSISMGPEGEPILPAKRFSSSSKSMSPMRQWQRQIEKANDDVVVFQALDAIAPSHARLMSPWSDRRPVFENLDLGGAREKQQPAHR
jgi:hypothetical protein